jgi:hypothetical protein
MISKMNHTGLLCAFLECCLVSSIQRKNTVFCKNYFCVQPHVRFWRATGSAGSDTQLSLYPQWFMGQNMLGYNNDTQ